MFDQKVQTLDKLRKEEDIEYTTLGKKKWFATLFKDAKEMTKEKVTECV